MYTNRRELLKKAALLAAALPCSTTSRLFAASTAPAQNRSDRIVVIAQRPQALRPDGSPEPDVLSAMLNDAVCRITGVTPPRAAWQSIFKPGEKIGIKVNAMGGIGICTHAELAFAAARQLAAAGIPERDIIIWDRLTVELERGGYTIRQGDSGTRCFGTDNDYESRIETAGAIGSCFSRIIASCDALINIPVLKDHDLSGVSLGLKNFYGAIHNPNKYHDNGCDPFIADLNTHPHIRGKLRLTIIDGLRGQYNGGPACRTQWQWPYAGLIISRDPVAADAVGASLIEEQRKKHGLPSLADAGRPARHIQTAAVRGLGIAEPKSIQTVLV